jgi:hypothetical protein
MSFNFFDHKSKTGLHIEKTLALCPLKFDGFLLLPVDCSTTVSCSSILPLTEEILKKQDNTASVLQLKWPFALVIALMAKKKKNCRR